MTTGETPPVAETATNPQLPMIVWTYSYDQIAFFYAARDDLNFRNKVEIGFSPIDETTAEGLAELIKLTRQREREISFTGRNRLEMVDPTAENLLAKRDSHGVLAFNGEMARIDEIWRRANVYTDKKEQTRSSEETRP